jgi:hypothetical protein
MAALRHGWLGGLSRLAGAALRLRRPLGLAVGVGAAVGLGCYLAGPALAAAVSGVAGFAASLATSALRAVQGTLARAASPHPKRSCDALSLLTACRAPGRSTPQFSGVSPSRATPMSSSSQTLLHRGERPWPSPS